MNHVARWEMSFQKKIVRGSNPRRSGEFVVISSFCRRHYYNGLAFFYVRRGEGLSKTAIGDYLGEKSPFHEQVLKAFVDLHDFTDLIIVQALRYIKEEFSLSFLQNPTSHHSSSAFLRFYRARFYLFWKLTFSLPDLQTIPVEFQTSRRSSKDRQNDGDLRSAVLSAQPQHFLQSRYFICFLLHSDYQVKSFFFPIRDESFD